MKTASYLFLIFSIVISNFSYSQTNWVELFFDGGDTTEYTMHIELDTAAENIWQIGLPQKQVFYNSFTLPSALMTDTINDYPNQNTSIFRYGLHEFYPYGITAIQWVQKIDLDSGDIAMIEFSIDSGMTWDNAFTSPNTYNFYGYDFSNVDTLGSGEIGFSGRDTNWRDIWLCFDYSWMSMQDTILVRHVLKTDSITSNNEGWMIDNMMQHLTFFHTLPENPQEAYVEVFPNPASRVINISVKKENQFHIIKELTLIAESGEILEKHFNVPTKYFIDVDKYANGIYFLKVQTNLKTETKRIVINH